MYAKSYFDGSPSCGSLFHVYLRLQAGIKSAQADIKIMKKILVYRHLLYVPFKAPFFWLTSKIRSFFKEDKLIKHYSFLESLNIEYCIANLAILFETQEIESKRD